jgi:hypothetical protein
METRPIRDRAELLKTLSYLLDRLDPFDYRLVGTGAALAQGVDLPTGDIDVLVKSREVVDAFAAALAGHPCLDPPKWLPPAQQYFTHYTVDDIKVGASTVEVITESEAVECIGRGPWQHYVDVEAGKHTVPAVALELRLVSELIRNRPDRYTPLIDHLRANGADLELVRRSMKDRNLNPARQREILGRLALPATGGDNR